MEKEYHVLGKWSKSSVIDEPLLDPGVLDEPGVLLLTDDRIDDLMELDVPVFGEGVKPGFLLGDGE